MASKEYRQRYNRAYYLKNKEREQERVRVYYHKNKDNINKEERKRYLSEYYQNNKIKYKRTSEQQSKYNDSRRARYAQSEEVREAARTQAREWQENNPQKRKAQRIKKYNLTLAEFDALLESQNGGCAICGYSDRSVPKYFPIVDHCHTTGKIRGLLCANCNHALGKFKDNPATLRHAAEYLEENCG